MCPSSRWVSPVFAYPWRFVGPDGEDLTLESGYRNRQPGCRQEGHKPCIIRIFYEYEKERSSPEVLDRVLRHYKKELDSREARIKVDFSYPMVQKKPPQWVGRLPVL